MLSNIPVIAGLDPALHASATRDRTHLAEGNLQSASAL
jgi:hypothetical protein